jgi:hypothetical protein
MGERRVERLDAFAGPSNLTAAITTNLSILSSPSLTSNSNEGTRGNAFP